MTLACTFFELFHYIMIKGHTKLCKAPSDEVSCSRTITLACIFFYLFPFHYFLSQNMFTLLLQNCLRHEKTSQICKTPSDKVSCKRTLCLACIFPHLFPFHYLFVTKTGLRRLVFFWLFVCLFFVKKKSSSCTLLLFVRKVVNAGYLHFLCVMLLLCHLSKQRVVQ